MSEATLIVPVLRERRNDAWLKECLASFPQGTPYIVAENDGELAKAMNEALAMVETEWVIPFGHDDVAEPGMVETLLAAGRDVDVVYPSMVLTDEQLSPLGVFNADLFCPNRLQTWNYVPGGFAARTATVRAAGGWRDLDTFEDWDLHLRMSRNGARFKACPEARFLYRQVEGSRNRQDRGFGSVREMRDHYQRLIVGEPPDVKATFYYQATPAVAYWRCILPARKLPGIARTDLAFDGDESQILDHQGAAIFQFPADNQRAYALKVMRDAGARYLVEVDDNYLDETDALIRQRAGWTLRIGRSKEEWRAHPHSVEGHRYIVEHADGVIVSTPSLAEAYGEINENVFVCPNAIDPDDWPEYVKHDDGVFRIGWFASRSHDRDSPLVRRALSWASRQPDVEVVTCGLDPPDWTFQRTHVDWSDDMSVYRRQLMRLDVGVAPIVRTGWSRHRSDLKALEYATAGVLPVLSMEEPYAGWRNRPALLAHSAKDFEEQIRWCVKNRDETRQLAERARDYVLTERTIGAQIHLWETAVEG